MHKVLLVALALAALPSSSLHAQVPPASQMSTLTSATPVNPVNPPDTVLLQSKTIVLKQADYDYELLRLPAETRGGFGANIDRINALLRSILTNKTRAASARKAGLDQTPEMQLRIAAEVDKILAQALVESQFRQWETEFNALPNLDQAAREKWLTQPERFTSPEQFRATQILFAVPPRTTAEARALAGDARAKIVGGADMNAVAREISDDPAAKQTGGVVDSSGEGADPRLARAVLALAKPGDLSQPVQTRMGVAVVRLDEKQLGKLRPFDEAKAEILVEMRKAYVETKFKEQTELIRDDPSVVVNSAAVERLVVRPDAELLRKAEDARRDAGRVPGAPPPPQTAPK